jgi:hypothetical protein
MLPEGGMSVAESIPSSMGGTGASTGSLLGDVAGKTVAGPMSMAPGTTTVASQLGINAAPVAMTPTQVAALQSTAPTGFGSVGAGVKDLFSTGGFDRFGTALTQQTGGGLGTTASLVGVGTPIVNAMQPTYDFPEVAEATSNYAGPYRPSERQVRYPTLRDAEDSSEFQYFDTVNPYPGFVTAASDGNAGGINTTMPTERELAEGLGAFDMMKRFNQAQLTGTPYNFRPTYAAAGGYMQRYQEGGEVMPDVDRAIRMPSTLSTAGTAPEFNYNFRPVEVMAPPPTLNSEPRGLGSIFSRALKKVFNREPEYNYTDLSKYRYDPDSQQMTPMAQGGLAGLNAFNKGGMPKGRFLQGAGDGTSDSIPATIGGSQPARLADGEFVIDARTVSEIGNGSSKAGAKKLYAMMERVHKERKKAKRGQDSNADRYLPA